MLTKKYRISERNLRRQTFSRPGTWRNGIPSINGFRKKRLSVSVLLSGWQWRNRKILWEESVCCAGLTAIMWKKWFISMPSATGWAIRRPGSWLPACPRSMWERLILTRKFSILLQLWRKSGVLKTRKSWQNT